MTPKARVDLGLRVEQFEVKIDDDSIDYIESGDIREEFIEGMENWLEFYVENKDEDGVDLPITEVNVTVTQESNNAN